MREDLYKSLGFFFPVFKYFRDWKFPVCGFSGILWGFSGDSVGILGRVGGDEEGGDGQQIAPKSSGTSGGRGISNLKSS